MPNVSGREIQQELAARGDPAAATPRRRPRGGDPQACIGMSQRAALTGIG